MAILIKSITGSFPTSVQSNVIYLKSVSGQVQGEDYINLDAFIAFLQNMSRTELLVPLEKPMIFGLKYTPNTQYTAITINY